MESTAEMPLSKALEPQTLRVQSQRSRPNMCHDTPHMSIKSQITSFKKKKTKKRKEDAEKS